MRTLETNWEAINSTQTSAKPRNYSRKMTRKICGILCTLPCPSLIWLKWWNQEETGHTGDPPLGQKLKSTSKVNVLGSLGLPWRTGIHLTWLKALRGPPAAVFGSPWKQTLTLQHVRGAVLQAHIRWNKRWWGYEKKHW